MVITWEEALAERENRGRAAAMQETILLVATHRFVKLPGGFEDKIRGIGNPDRLEELLLQILGSDSITDVVPN